jgi:polysaccharide deacetylase 2 family uncharacterized protein YibQ
MLILTQMDGAESSSTMLDLANVLHMQENHTNEELRLILAGTSMKTAKPSSVKMMRVHIRFDRQDEYFSWLRQLNEAIQQAKDQSWSKTNEIVI